jgi:hypothetical protein
MAPRVNLTLTHQLLYPQGQTARNPLERTVSGPRSQSGRGGEEKNPYPYRESNSGRPIRGLDTIQTDLRRLFGRLKEITKLLTVKIPVIFRNAVNMTFINKT